jgi:hypothetical protein
MKYISYLKDLPATQRQKRPTIGAKETYYKNEIHILSRRSACNAVL